MQKQTPGSAPRGLLDYKRGTLHLCAAPSSLTNPRAGIFEGSGGAPHTQAQIESLLRSGRPVYLLNGDRCSKFVERLRSIAGDVNEHGSLPLVTTHHLYDVVGDVHGRPEALKQLARQLGYDVSYDLFGTHPDGRELVFVGDLVNKGPDSLEVLNLVLPAVRAGRVRLVKGNHELVLERRLQELLRLTTSNRESFQKELEEKLQSIRHSGSKGALEEISSALRDRIIDIQFIEELAQMLAGLPCYLKLNGGELIVAHAAFDSKFIDGPVAPKDIPHLVFGPRASDEGNHSATAPSWQQELKAALKAAIGTGKISPRTVFVHGHHPVPIESIDGKPVEHILCVDTDAGAGGNLSAYQSDSRAVVTVKV